MIKMAKEKIYFVIIIIVSSLLLLGFFTFLITRDKVNIKQVALNAALEDFFTIREEDENYFYSIKELGFSDITLEKGQSYKLYEIIVVDNELNKETYLVGVLYKTDFLYRAFSSSEYTLKNKIIEVKIMEV